MTPNLNSLHHGGDVVDSNNTNQSPVKEVSRHSTGTSGSGSDGVQDIIPGGDFDEPDLQHGNLQKNATSWRGFVRPSDIMALPHTPQQRLDINGRGLQDSTGKDSYRTVSFSPLNHYNRAGESDTAMDSIGEQTQRMNMVSIPNTYLSTSSPTSTSIMQPSAFRLAGLPMTPNPSSSCSVGDQVANNETQPQPIHFAPSQPVMQFVPGPPMHMPIEQPGSKFPFANSFEGQSNAQFIPQVHRAPLHQAFMGLPLSDSTRSDLTATTCGFPSTPADSIRPNFQNSNNFPCHVKMESGDSMTVFANDTSQQQHSSGKQPADLPGSPSRAYSIFDTRRHYHPYRLTQTEPISRIATLPVASNHLPATPSVFAFSHPLPAMANVNSSPTPVQRGSLSDGTTQPTNTQSKHHHSGSLQFPMTSSTAVLRGDGLTARAPYVQSMSLPNQGMAGRHPVSPGGESLKSDIESEFDDDWAGTTRGSRAPLPLQIFGSQGPSSSNSPRLPKKHICRLCGKAFNRPSSLNTHMAVHTGAKPYQCPKRDCGRKFSVSSNLRRHMKTHEIKEQARVAQLTARELAAQSHFEVNPVVKQEPEDNLANDGILEEEEKELENGSIVYDDNGRAYRYYASESAYQAAIGGLPETPVTEQPFQWARHPADHQTSSSGALFNSGVFNQNPPFTSLPFHCGLGNAAPAPLSSPMPTGPQNGQHAPFEQWMPGRNAMFDISSGVSLNRPLALGNAGATVQGGS